MLPASRTTGCRIDRYINWSSHRQVGKNDFYTDYQCRQMYKQHLYTFTHRKNTYQWPHLPRGPHHLLLGPHQRAPLVRLSVH